MPRQGGIAILLILALLVCHGALGSVHQLSAQPGPGVGHETSHETVLHPESVHSGFAGTSYYATSLLALGALGVALSLLSLVRIRPPWGSLLQPQVLRLAKVPLQKPPGPPGLARLQVFRI